MYGTACLTGTLPDILGNCWFGGSCYQRSWGGGGFENTRRATV